MLCGRVWFDVIYSCMKLLILVYLCDTSRLKLKYKAHKWNRC